MPDDALTQHGAPANVYPTHHGARHWRHGATYWTLPLTGIFTASHGIGAAEAPPSASRAPTTTPATQPLDKSAAAQLVRRFQADLRANDPAAAARNLATFAQPLRDTDRRLARMAKLYSGRTWDLSVLDAFEAGDVAVVLVNEHLKDGRRTFDVDPWYLVRQNGEWKLLPKPTDYDVPAYAFDPARLTEFQKLESWATARKAQLRKQQPDCGC